MSTNRRFMIDRKYFNRKKIKGYKDTAGKERI